jgi:hypothetical protein
MSQWRYAIVPSNGGQVQMPSGPASIAQPLNSAGQQGGELVAVVPAGPAVFEWVIKFPIQAPPQAFE